jgi:hypothetical protein
LVKRKQQREGDQVRAAGDWRKGAAVVVSGSLMKMAARGTQAEKLQVVVIFVAAGEKLQVVVRWWLGGAPPRLAWPRRRPVVKQQRVGEEKCQASSILGNRLGI